MLKERPEKLEKLGVYGLSLGKRALCKQHEVVSRKEGLVKESQELDKRHNPGGSSTGWCVYLQLELQRKPRRDDFTTSGAPQALMQGPLDACHATSPGVCEAYFRLADVSPGILLRRIFISYCPDHKAPPPILL